VPGGGTITIAAPRHCAVADLKLLIEDRTDIPAAEQRLLSGGCELEDAQTFTAGSALHLVLDLCGGMEDGEKAPILLPPKRRRAAAAAAGASPPPPTAAGASPPPPTPQQSDGEASDADDAGGGGDGGDRDSGVGAGEVSAATPAMTAERAAADDSVVVALQLLLHVASPGHGAENPNDF